MGSLLSGAQQAVSGLVGGVSSSLTPQNTYNVPVGQSTVQIQNNQQALAQALLAQSQGQGPNPAQAALNQQTNQNIQQNQGMIASQKGINPALATRLAAENAGNMNQQAAGQAATLQAQQQLGAQGQLGTVYNQEQQGTNAANSINAGTSAQNAAANQNTASGLLNGAGAAVAALAHGGMVQKFDSGGQVSSSQSIANSILQQAGVPLWGAGNNSSGSSSGSKNSASELPNSLMGGPSQGMSMAGGAGDAGAAGGAGDLIVAAAHGGKIPPHLSLVQDIFHPQAGTAQLKANGGKVPGTAKVPGDSPQNDTVKTMLSPGEVVIPRSVMQSKDPAKEAAKFVADHLKKSGKSSEGSPEDFKAALKKAISSRKGA